MGAFTKGASDVFNASLTHRKLQEEIRSRMSSVYVSSGSVRMAEKLRRAIGVKVKLYQILQLESD